MNTKVMKLAARAYMVMICTAAPVAMVHAQTGGAGGGAAGTAASQPAGATAAGTARAGQGDQGYTQAQDNNNRGGGSKAGWLGLLGLLGLLGMRRRDTHTTNVRDTTPSYETTGTRRP